MEIVFWMIVAMFVIAVVYALSFRKRKEALGREPCLLALQSIMRCSFLGNCSNRQPRTSIPAMRIYAF